MLLSAHIIRALVFFTVIQTCCCFSAAVQFHTVLANLLPDTTISNEPSHALQWKMYKQFEKLLSSTQIKDNRLNRKVQYAGGAKAHDLFTDNVHCTDLQTKLTAYSKRLQSLRTQVQSVKAGLQTVNDTRALTSSEKSNFECVRREKIKSFLTQKFSV